MTDRRLKAVIFDLFGTLVFPFSRSLHEQVITNMAAAVSVDRDEFARVWAAGSSVERVTGVFATIDENIEHICRSLGVTVDEESLSVAVRVRVDHTRRTLEPRPDAVATLNQLRNSGYKLGLLSNCSADVPLVWPETEFAPLIESPVFSCSVGLKKPDPRIYQVACGKLNVEPADCLYVGDGSDRELTGALEAGVSVLDVKGFQVPGAYSSVQGVPRCATECSCNSSLRITATNATFPGFPRLRSCW